MQMPDHIAPIPAPEMYFICIFILNSHLVYLVGNDGIEPSLMLCKSWWAPCELNTAVLFAGQGYNRYTWSPSV